MDLRFVKQFLIVVQILFAYKFASLFFYVSNRGIDLTDEGLYLLAAAQLDPEAVFNSPSGTYTNLIYEAAGQNVSNFRLLGVLLMFVAGCWLGFNVFKAISKNNESKKIFILKLPIIFGFGFTSLHYYFYMIQTPSYNWLTLFGLIICAGSLIGLITWVNFHNKASTFAVLFLLSSGIILSTFGKPSSFFGVGLLFAVGILFRRDFSNKKWNLTALALPLITHHLLVQNWANSYELFKIGFSNYSLLVADTESLIPQVLEDTVSYFIAFPENLLAELGMWLFLDLIFLSIIVLLQSSKRIGVASRDSLLGIWFAFTVCLLFYKNGFNGGIKSYSDYWLLNISLFVVALTIWLVTNLVPSGSRRWKDLNVLLIAFATASLYAFGSANGFGAQFNVSFVIICSGVVIVVSDLIKWQNLPLIPVAFSLLMPALVLSALNDGLEDPYRVKPIHQQTKILTLEFQNNQKILVDDLTYSQINDFQIQAKLNGWVPGTPIFDLTRFTPTILYALDALPPPTLLLTVGGWPGDELLLESSVNQILDSEVDSKIWEQAWLIAPDPAVDPEFKTTPNPEFLREFGKEFPLDYELLINDSGYWLYKPK